MNTSAKRRIVILAGRKSHGPDDNGIHDYPAIARSLHDALMRSVVASDLHIDRYENDTWPSSAIAEADALVVISDGRDNDRFQEASHLSTPERKTEMETAVARGMGVVVIHFSTFAAEADAERALNWQGAYFKWQNQDRRDWHSRISWATSMLTPVGEHPILNGVTPQVMREEFYHRLVFHPQATPLLAAPALAAEEPHERCVAWCLQRPQGGRSFGTTMIHSLDSLRNDAARTLVVNGIAWASGVDIPADGLQVPFAEREDVAHRLGLGAELSPIRVAMLSGNAAHRWHNWPETTAALLRVWADDARIRSTVFTDPNDLAPALERCDVLVLNWCNWEDPQGMPEATKQAIMAFVERGGGIFIHHFANGACHPSLPKAGASDWPWYRILVRRVWDHRDLAPGRSQHDRFRNFEVRPQGNHPLVADLPAFTIDDELYWHQHGDEPITVGLVATSETTGQAEPLLWHYDLGQARIVQSLLGHSARSYEPHAMGVLARRIIAWCAKRAIHGPARSEAVLVAQAAGA